MACADILHVFHELEALLSMILSAKPAPGSSSSPPDPAQNGSTKIHPRRAFRLHISPAGACCYLRAASWISKQQSENAADFARIPLESKSWLNVGICMGTLISFLKQTGGIGGYWPLKGPPPGVPHPDGPVSFATPHCAMQIEALLVTVLK
jgi:hypothetical protein